MPGNSSEVVPLRQLWWVILLAIAGATVANVLFFYLVTGPMGQLLLVPEQFPPLEAAPLPVEDVILFSVIFSMGACIVFILIAYLVKRPIRTYIVVALVVLTLLNFLPFRAPDPPVTMATKLTLVMMHVIGAVVVVGTLVGLGRRRG
jgi:hypothetical protein